MKHDVPASVASLGGEDPHEQFVLASMLEYLERPWCVVK